MSSKTDKDRASVCAFLFADGRRCRMLMFGVTTAIIFAAIQRLIEAKFGPQHDSLPKAG